jgi:choline dehydrogenase-like flavoprotein
MKPVERNYKYAIIGSGASGGILAAGLAQTQEGIIVVEAGKHYTSRDFPMDQYNLGRLYWKSALQFTHDFGVNLTRGLAVGGSTIVYQALFDEFPDYVWDRWRKKSGVPFFDRKQMDPYYHKVLGSFRTEVLPESLQNENARIFLAGMSAIGYRTRPLRRAHRNCRHDEGYNCIDSHE